MSSTLVIFPGADWTVAGRQANQGFQRWLESHLELEIEPVWISGSPWDGGRALQLLQERGIDPQSPVVIVAFSAGVVGAMAVHGLWRGAGGLIAVDGWCVPLGASRGPLAGLWSRPHRPMARLSHDLETHWNGVIFGAGQDQFYADPFVSHHQIWSQPNRVTGWARWAGDPRPVRITAAEFLLDRVRAFLSLSPQGL